MAFSIQNIAIMNLTQMIKEVQTALKIQTDGLAGPETWKAVHKKIVGTKAAAEPESPAAPAAGMVDERSEKNIATLLPEVHDYARSLVQRAAALGITIKVISGLRTYEEQNALYAKGRTTAPIGKKHIVSNARGGYSNHNFGLAFDIGVFEGTKYVTSGAQYDAVGAIGKELGLEWGGSWKSFVDKPHYQLRPTWAAGLKESEMLAELRRRRASGKPAFA